MEEKPPTLSSRMSHFARVCQERGLKRTHQRIEIFRELARANDHPDAEQLLVRIRKRLPTISLDTIYRTLWLLVDLGLVQTFYTSRERTRFDANLDYHHHFVCRSCGMARDFDGDAFDNLHLPDTVSTFGVVETTQVEVRGVCHNCRSALDSPAGGETG